MNVFQEERDENIALKEKQKKEKAEQQARCKDARRELKEFREASFLYKDTDDPYNPEILSDTERKNEENEYAEYIKKNC